MISSEAYERFARLRPADLQRLPAPEIGAGLREVIARRPRLTDEISWLMRQAELRAVSRATATPHIGAVLAEAVRSGCQVAIVSNNSPEAIGHYLDRSGGCSAIAVVIGRDIRMDLAELKPSPYMLRKALAATQTAAA